MSGREKGAKGLGKGGAKRHRTVLRDNIPKASPSQPSAVSRVVEVSSASGLIYEESNEEPPSKRAKRHCQHGWQRSVCKECGGARICQHGWQRSVCKECGGAGICLHQSKDKDIKLSCDYVEGFLIESSDMPDDVHAKSKPNLSAHDLSACQCKECGGGSICAVTEVDTASAVAPLQAKLANARAEALHRASDASATAKEEPTVAEAAEEEPVAAEEISLTDEDNGNPSIHSAALCSLCCPLQHITFCGLLELSVCPQKETNLDWWACASSWTRACWVMLIRNSLSAWLRTAGELWCLCQLCVGCGTCM